ncbi:MAG: TetR family transcriptional regulator [Thermomicrobiales bacterium]|nr:TetR family transcriptional regulator [Thermomicrobiales bacterium]
MVTSGERTRERNPQGEGARLREELIAAAGRLLAEDGDIDALSLRGVAREAGVAAPSVYLHFSSKEDLLRAVVGAHFAALQRAIETGVASGHDPTSRLLAGCLAYCRYATDQPGSYHLLFNTPRPDIIPDARRRRGGLHCGRRGAARRPVPHRDRYLVGAARYSLTAPRNDRVPLAAAGRPGTRHTGGVHRHFLPRSRDCGEITHDGAA